MYASNPEQRSRERVQVLADKLYRERYSHLFRIALKNATNADDAQEAVNEAFASFLRAYDPASEAPPLAWLTLTLKRECWAKSRRQHMDRRACLKATRDSTAPGFSVDELPAVTGDAELAIERSESTLEARKRLAALKPAERRALVLIAAGFSYDEIGSMCDWSYTKVNRCAAEGRATLRSAGALAEGRTG